MHRSNADNKAFYKWTEAYADLLFGEGFGTGPKVKGPKCATPGPMSPLQRTLCLIKLTSAALETVLGTGRAMIGEQNSLNSR